MRSPSSGSLLGSPTIPKDEEVVHDIALAFIEDTPAPLHKHLRNSLVNIGFEVVYGESLYLLKLPATALEAHAESLSLEVPLSAETAKKWSEELYPVRKFRQTGRIAFAARGVPVAFTPAERATITLDYLDRKLLCDSTAWSAALVASGKPEAASSPKKEWLVGPVSGWSGQPMLGALEALGYLSAASPIHGAGQQQSTGLPLTSGTLVPWLKTALLTGQIVSVDSIRGYWGESVAYYFGWQQFYIRSLLLPALAGLYVWLLRPVDVTVDDDPNVPLYSLLAVVWAIVFVTTWRSKAAEYAFKWGTANAQSGAVLRSEFVGVESVDAVTGAKVLVDPPVKRALRLLFSGLITALSLLVPVGAMITSLNLQGYIVASTGAWNGIPVYVPELAKHARPGELFDPNGDSLVMPLVPVILHAITIQVLNSLFKGVASALTSFENHRSASTHDASMLIKRFAFEACDCYLALFYIAFELQDVPKLRAELVALFTADTVRRVLLETVVPMLLNWKAVRAVATTPRTGKASASAVAAEMEMEPYEDFDVSACYLLPAACYLLPAAHGAFDVSPHSLASFARIPSSSPGNLLPLPSHFLLLIATSFPHRYLLPLTATTPSPPSSPHCSAHCHPQDYLEMVIQFGYVTLFASAFPLAPAICMVSGTTPVATWHQASGHTSPTRSSSGAQCLLPCLSSA